METNWLQSFQPLMLGSVAIGGITQVTKQVDRLTPSHIQKFIYSIVLGLTICAIFNIYWRMDQCEDQSNLTDGSGDSAGDVRCDRNTTLEYSLSRGVVITNILTELFPNMTQIQPLVAFSLVIAFISLGSGFLDTVCSFGLQLAVTLVPESEHVSVKWSAHKFSTILQFIVSAVAFLVVYGISLYNPKGFLIILERVASACLNMTNSIFLRTMIMNARYMTIDDDLFPFTGPVYYFLTWLAQIWGLSLLVLDLVTWLAVIH